MHPLLQKNILKTSKKLAAVSLQIVGKEQVVYHVLLMEKKKQEIQIMDRRSDLVSDDQLAAFIPANMPVVVNLEGWGILSKECSYTPDGTIKTQVVPNTDEFEIYPYPQGNMGFVSIIRTELMQDIFTRLQAIKLNLVQLSIGPFSAAPAIALLELEGNHQIGNVLLEINKTKIQSVKAHQGDDWEQYTLPSDRIGANYMTAYGMGLQFFQGQYGKDVINQTILLNYSYRQLNTYTTWAVLGVLLMALFINYLLFDHYNKEYNQISGEYTRHASVLNQLKKAELELQQKETLVLKGGLGGKTQFAWRTDRLVALMPHQLTLTKLAVHPEAKKIQKGKEIIFQEHLFSIEGTTHDALAVHDWIKQLRQETWIKEVEMVYYHQEEAGEPAIFNLELVY